MKQLCIYILVFITLTGCRVQYPVRDNVRNLTALHVRDSVAVNYIPVKLKIPMEAMKWILPSSDTSRLETSVAKSEAFVDSTGLLHHSLENKAGAVLETEVPVEEHWHSEQQQDSHSEQNTIIEEIEKPLSRWQIFWIRSGQVFWILTIGALAGWLIRKFLFKK